MKHNVDGLLARLQDIKNQFDARHRKDIAKIEELNQQVVVNWNKTYREYLRSELVWLIDAIDSDEVLTADDLKEHIGNNRWDNEERKFYGWLKTPQEVPSEDDVQYPSYVVAMERLLLEAKKNGMEEISTRDLNSYGFGSSELRKVMGPWGY